MSKLIEKVEGTCTVCDTPCFLCVLREGHYVRFAAGKEGKPTEGKDGGAESPRIRIDNKDDDEYGRATGEDVGADE